MVGIFFVSWEKQVVIDYALYFFTPKPALFAAHATIKNQTIRAVTIGQSGGGHIALPMADVAQKSFGSSQAIIVGGASATKPTPIQKSAGFSLNFIFFFISN